MNIEKIYGQLKAFDPELPTMVVGLLKPCGQTYCDCRQQLEEDGFVLHCARKSYNTQKTLDGSIKALMNNPNMLFLSQVLTDEDKHLASSKTKVDSQRIELIELK